MDVKKTIRARFTGLCAACPDDIAVGDMITVTEDGQWKHEDCEATEPPFGRREPRDPEEPVLDTMAPEEARAKMCDRCFTVHAPGQKECW